MPRSHLKSDTRRIARFAAIAIVLLLIAFAAWTLLERRQNSRLPSENDHGSAVGSQASAAGRLAVLPFENLQRLTKDQGK